MKKFDLEKNKALKLTNGLKQNSASSFGPQTAYPKLDKREQRRLDQEKGLVPFACKLPGDLAATLRERSVAHAGGINGLVEELLRKGLG